MTDTADVHVFLKLVSFDNPVQAAYFEERQLITIEKNSDRVIRWEIDPSVWKSHVCENVTLTSAQIEEWNSLTQNTDYQAVCK